MDIDPIIVSTSLEALIGEFKSRDRSPTGHVRTSVFYVIKFVFADQTFEKHYRLIFSTYYNYYHLDAFMFSTRR